MSYLPLCMLALFRAIERMDRSAIQAVSRHPDPVLRAAARLAAEEVSGGIPLPGREEFRGGALGTTMPIEHGFSTLTNVERKPKSTRSEPNSKKPEAPKPNGDGASRAGAGDGD